MLLERDWIQRLPKVELHVHLDGSLRPQTMIELADEAGIRLPARDAASLAEAMLVRDVTCLEEYLDRYRVTIALMQTREAIRRIARELVLDLAAENVRYFETRFCPALHTPAMSDAEAIEAALAGLREGSDASDCEARLIVCGLRTMPSETSTRMARAAVEARDRGVVAFDLAGAEAGHPAKDHAGAFDIARDGGLRLTCHAGEGYGPDSVRQALEDCGAERLGHGTRLHEDPQLENEVLERGVPLEVCVTSNVHTRTVDTAASHPVRRYLERGHCVTLNTDGRLMDGITLTDEYWLAHRELGFDANELRQVVHNAASSAFLGGAERQSLLERIERELADLDGGEDGTERDSA